MKFVPISFFIVKVHALCNLNCTYCYEYNLGNDGWKYKPKFMTIEVFERLCERIAEHMESSPARNDEPFISLHGGEPLLRKPEFFSQAIPIAKSIIPNIKFGMQSNGTLLRQDYIDIFLEHDLTVGLSIDGPKETNDKNRIDHREKGSFDRIIKGLSLLQKPSNKKAWGGALSVIDIDSDPIKIMNFLAELDPPGVDLLEPDGTWNRLPPGKSSASSTEYADWLIKAFDYWINNLPSLKVRRFEEIMEHLLGGSGTTEYFGVEPANLITVATDGAYEAVDQIKGSYNGAEHLGLDVFSNSLDEVVKHKKVQDRLIGLSALSSKCLNCEYLDSCGGGYYPHRYKKKTGFKNPSIYCSDYLKLFAHIKDYLNEKVVNKDASTKIK